MQKVLYLRKVRDFGEKIGDSFLFLKGNWKNLLSIYAVFVVPLIIAASILGMFFAGRLYSAMLSNAVSIQVTDIFSGEFFVIILCLLMAGSSYNTAIYGYFRLYDEQKGVKPTISQVSQLFFPRFIKLFFYNIFVVILLVLVAVLPLAIIMFIPLVNLLGILLFAVVFATVLFHLNCIYVAEDVGFWTGISRLLDLFKDRWWPVIGYSSVMFIIYYVFASVIQVIFMMIFAVGALNMISPAYPPSDAGTSQGKISMMVLAFGGMILLQQVFYLILYSAIGINYYSLCEEKDGSAIEEEIESIGATTDKYGGVEEQY
ncbi:MAG: hypothetical protein H7Y27_03900 [Gemmatimonadaceae bacterium]|nr:hypothetical protein [Chitinophagaceae bacterium]